MSVQRKVELVVNAAFTWVKEAGSTSAHDVHAENPDWMVVSDVNERVAIPYIHNRFECVCRDIVVVVREVKAIVPSHISEQGL